MTEKEKTELKEWYFNTFAQWIEEDYYKGWCEMYRCYKTHLKFMELMEKLAIKTHTNVRINSLSEINWGGLKKWEKKDFEEIEKDLFSFGCFAVINEYYVSKATERFLKKLEILEKERVNERN